uniref:Zgc:103625 n=1 Tax=Tetraodon nigroviridis TaxID=99883 RepID=H3C1H0_TETNG
EMLLSPQAERNWESLCCVLEDVLENQSHRQLFALELGSGTGQHVIRFAQKIPFVTWQPSDITQECLDSIKAYIAATCVKTVLQPVQLDASQPWQQWTGVSQESCDVILAVNLLQYSAFKTAQGVFAGAGQVLKRNGLLLTYGAFAVNGTITPICNEQLDSELRKMNPEWGLPDMDVLRQLAYTNGMRLERIIEMEDFFKCLVFRKI